MIQKMMNAIVCPSCRYDDLFFIKIREENEMIIEGGIVCRSCDDLFIIQDGIVCLLPKELADINREIEFIERHKAEFPAKAVEKRVSVNSLADGNKFQQEWIIYEKNYWDSKVSKQKMLRPQYSFNRTGVRNNHILNHLKGEIGGKTLIEFGAGLGETLYFDMNPKIYNYDYFCTDISFVELQRARCLHDQAICIQCDAIHPPFKQNIFDIILNLGALHHLPDNISVLKNQIGSLKIGGKLALHEPINRRKAFLSKHKLFSLLKKKQSAHNDYIDEKNAMKVLLKLGKIINLKIEYSPVRTWLIKLFKDVLKFNQKIIFKVIIKIDDMVIKYIGKHFNSFDGNSILIVWEKLMNGDPI